MRTITKTTLLMSMLCLIHTQAAAQINLVPNPSFEEYEWCPTGYPDLDGNLEYWKSFRVTPDYFNDCSPVCGYYNLWGHQAPRTGKAYTGVTTYQASLPNAREHLGVKLLSPLNIGVKYYVTFYVSAAFSEQMNIVSNNIGILLTNNEYSDLNGANLLQNNTKINSYNIVKDTINWVKISGSFIADSAYQYLIIGNFFDDINTDTLHLPDLALGHYVSYYYLDDVCLSDDSTLCYADKSICDFVLPTAFTPNGDNINDTYKWVSNCKSLNRFEMNIYNRWGERVFSTIDSQVTWDGTYNGKESPQDVYAVYVSVLKDGVTYSKVTNVTLLK